MSLKRACVVLLSLLLTVLAFAKHAAAQTTPSSPAVVKDAKAKSIATQALNAAGGMAAIRTINDYTGTGTVTYYGTGKNGASGVATGSVTIRERGLTQLRIDAELPEGGQSQIDNGGMITFLSNGTTAKPFDQEHMYPGCEVLPDLFLGVASIGPDFSLTYKGVAKVDGNQTYELRVERVFSNPRIIRHPGIVATDIFIDTNTFQVVMLQYVNPHRQTYEIQFSDYKSQDGILVPFGISWQLQGRKLRAVQLNNISFNTGLQNADFQP